AHATEPTIARVLKRRVTLGRLINGGGEGQPLGTLVKAHAANAHVSMINAHLMKVARCFDAACERTAPPPLNVERRTVVIAHGVGVIPRERNALDRSPDNANGCRQCTHEFTHCYLTSALGAGWVTVSLGNGGGVCSAPGTSSRVRNGSSAHVPYTG